MPEPSSPGLGSVDALFDSLCADLGVEPESEAPPPVRSRSVASTMHYIPPVPPVPEFQTSPHGSNKEFQTSPHGSGKEPNDDSSQEDAESEVVAPGRSINDASTRSMPGRHGADQSAPGEDRHSRLRNGSSQLFDTAALGTTSSYDPTRRPASAVARAGRVACASNVEAPQTAAPPRSRGLPGGQARGGPMSQPVHAEQRRSRQIEPWTTEESAQLRRTVKRIVKKGGCERGDALWEAVSRELGGTRGPRECKQQYARDYRAHKASRAELGAGGVEENLGVSIGPSVERLAAAVR